jgi:hypothetical protein
VIQSKMQLTTVQFNLLANTSTYVGEIDRITIILRIQEKNEIRQLFVLYRYKTTTLQVYKNDELREKAEIIVLSDKENVSIPRNPFSILIKNRKKTNLKCSKYSLISVSTTKSFLNELFFSLTVKFR